MWFGHFCHFSPKLFTHIHYHIHIHKNDQTTPAQKNKIGWLQQSKKGVFEIWTKMATKCKPQGPRFKFFGFWTKVAKVSKPQGPFWLLTLNVHIWLPS
ncbi:hypothetical protein Hanom_Chr09g00777091 [Helianthus anomalus]